MSRGGRKTECGGTSSTAQGGRGMGAPCTAQRTRCVYSFTIHPLSLRFQGRESSSLSHLCSQVPILGSLSASQAALADC